MQSEADKISRRFLKYGVNIIKVIKKIKNGDIEKHISIQLLRSAASAGADYEEACGIQSKADFIHKLQSVLNEIRESFYWLKLIKESENTINTDMNKLTDETEQLSNIFGKSLITAKTEQ